SGAFRPESSALRLTPERRATTRHRMMRACVLGCAGTTLTDDERALFERAQPFGFILFARNIESPEQVRALTGEMRTLVGRDAARGMEAARLGARLIAAELSALGINVDCLPVADLLFADGHGIIGDRAYGSDPAVVAGLARAAAEGLMEGGVLPVVKHIPGHGRARSDSHEELPVVETSLEELDGTDFESFRRLRDLPIAMTAHVVYTAVDPERAATV